MKKVEGYRYFEGDDRYNGIPFNKLLPNIEHNSTYFLGIPYAAPPTGNLRWKAPVDHEGWDGTLKGNLEKENSPQERKSLFFSL